MPLQVRWSSAVCACGCLKAEHNLAGDNRTRTGCSRAKCPALTTGGCQRYTHAVDRYVASTYLDVPAGAAAPQMALQRAEDADLWAEEAHARRLCHGSPEPHEAPRCYV